MIDKSELNDILVSVLAISLAFTIAGIGGIFGLLGGARPDILSFALLFAVSMFTVGIGFVLHEMAHKYLAIRFGCWAAYRAWPMGLLFALVSSLFGFIFAAPGATYIDPTYARRFTHRENGLISLIGPLTNIALALLFAFASPLFFALLPQEIAALVLIQGVGINLWLALFNMLPMGPLDGTKVMRWNPLIWGVTIVFTAIALFTGLFLRVGLAFASLY